MRNLKNTSKLIQCYLESIKKLLPNYKDRKRQEKELSKEDLTEKKKREVRNSKKMLLRKERKSNLMKKLENKETRLSEMD